MTQSNRAELITEALTSGRIGGLPDRHFIDGAFVPFCSGAQMETFDPGTGRAFAPFARGNSDDIDRAPTLFNRHELMIFLGGRVTLSDGADLSEDFSTGHIAFVPHRAPYKWASTEFVSKFYCIIMPTKQ